MIVPLLKILSGIKVWNLAHSKSMGALYAFPIKHWMYALVNFTKVRTLDHFRKLLAAWYNVCQMNNFFNCAFFFHFS